MVWPAAVRDDGPRSASYGSAVIERQVTWVISWRGRGVTSWARFTESAYGARETASATTARSGDCDVAHAVDGSPSMRGRPVARR